MPTPADPPTRFDLAVPGEIRFGAGRVRELPAVLTSLGVTRALVVTGRTTSRADAARAHLGEAGIESLVLPVTGEPTVDTVRAGVEVARRGGCDGVVGLGGGSALDVAKAVSLLALTGDDPLDHLEVVGRGRPIERPGLPWVAVPTTAGTGSEVTRNAVLSADGVKASLRSPHLLARVAIVDPDLLAGLPPTTIAHSGCDALTQLIEPYLSRRANPVTDALAREGIRRSARSLRTAYDQGLAGPSASGTREDLAVASLLGGLALANAGLGAVHGFAGVVGGSFDAPHGAVCAALLAPSLAVNAGALAGRASDGPARGRLTEVAVLLTGSPGATEGDAVEWVAGLVEDLDIPGLSAYGITDADVPDLVAGAIRASSMKANPVELTDAELTTMLTRAL
jgi:alcohol dehydrogenase class IV